MTIDAERLIMDQPPTSAATCNAQAALCELPTPAFFRIRDVLRITGLSRPTLYRRIAVGRFPPPVHLGGRACGWSNLALQAWIANPQSYRSSQTAVEAPPRRRGRPRKYAA